MSDFVWAIDENGKPTKCKAKPENRGKRNCTHKFHLKEGEPVEELMEKYNCRELKPTRLPKDYENYHYEKIVSRGRGVGLTLRIPKNDLISGAQVYSEGEWKNNPDIWYKAIRLEEEDHEEISSVEAIERIKENTIDSEIVEHCKDIAKELHKDQKDKNGKPYFNHPEAVANRCSSPYTKAIAYLHDTIEDTGVYDVELELYGVPRSVVKHVSLLSKSKDEDYMEYIKKISKNPIASEVKYCDLKHNTDLSRSNGEIMVSKEKWKKYQQALSLLNDIYGFED